MSTAILGLAAPAAGAASPAPPMADAGKTDAGKEAREAARFWTAERMANARPLDEIRSAQSAPGRPAAAAAAARPTGKQYGGTRLVGTFFGSGGPRGTAWHCTGSVIATTSKNIVLTAAHCGLNMTGDFIFVPKFVKGAGPDQQPYGIFHIQHIFTDPRYVPDRGSSTTKKPWSDLDTAFARVSANQHGKKLQDAVGGGLTFTRPSGYKHDVTVVGYPSHAHNSAGRAIKCTVPTKQLPGYRQMSMTCGGYYGGVSGSPWITDYKDGATSGHVIGNLGGYNGGGNDANVDYISYAPAFGADAANLLSWAVANQEPPSDLPPYKGIEAKLPGGAGRWRQARLMASGDYTGDRRSDLIVVRSNGETTLYPGDGKGGFRPEKRLRPANATWTHARAVTGGDFAGGDRSDLLVRWSDGEVTLYPDVSASGLGREVRMAKPGSVWKSAVQISAGRFHGGTRSTDLLVRWVDGELTLYTGVGAGTFGTEKRLLAPNATWKKATLLTSGTFSGSATGDVLVRWADGALDVYAGTSAAGLGARSRLRGPNALWKNDLVMTAGDYTANRAGDDLIVRWSDGETTLYADTGRRALGKESTLVYPGT
ncbi:V8-like Glu-specific endopeptidase [Streptomyces griseochromogenes]|uniref:V8-like Glu-specific endopeptidase n=2 Tax=Streptomyces griseochromogenes TaxID=68214 RepID=A0ABS4LKG2_9ACTN|nr:trypsin-like serine protease [Streptomyces griseochromogenes]MBP2047880.1 V8-like Glu-specific endopeptidase [Streptomyces griseochromogenes]